MNGAELLIDARKTNEISILSGYVNRMSTMECSRVAWLEFGSAPEDCECPSCSARECLATIAVMFEVYHATNERPGSLDLRYFGQA
jgi:hypothetical protein